MATFTYASGFSQDGIGVDGLTVSAYKASRFSSAPALNASPPGGGADATTTTGTATGFSGSFAIALPTSEAYYVTVTNGGTAYWVGPVYGVFEDGTAEGGSAAAGTMDPLGGVAGFAPLASPALTGTPTAPTASSGTNTTQLATAAFVQTAAGLLIPKSLVTTAGDLIAATGSGTVERLAKGTSGQVLTVGGADPSGLEWATPAAGGVSSFNARTGAVVPASGDYTVGEVTGAQPLLTLNAVKTGAFSCSSNNFYPLDSTGGSFTATLVGAPPDGTVCAFKLVASASPTNPVTIAASGSDVLNVAGTTTATIKLTQEAQYWVYRAANATWYAESSTPVGQLDSRYVQQATGSPLVISGSPAVGKVPVGTSGSAAVWQTPTPAPLPGAVILQGHSYLGAVNLGIPEPDLQKRYTASRIAGILGATADSVQQLTTAGSVLMASANAGTNGANDGSWGALFQKVLPPTAMGRAGYYNQGSGEAYLLSNQVNPPMPQVGQPTSVLLTGLNDIINDITAGYATTFTSSSASTGAGTITITGANYTTGGTYLPNRVGGAGIQAGDFITGTNISWWAEIASVAYTGGNTVITLTDSAQLTSNASETYTLFSGNLTQFKKAIVSTVTACAVRYVSGALVRSDDPSLTYGGTWTTVQQNSGNTGPSIRQTTVNGSTVAFTLPTRHPGGFVDFVFVGTSDLDNSGCTVTASTGGSTPNVAALTGSPVTTVGGMGWLGMPVPVVVRIPTTAADAGGTITFTFGTGSGGSPQVQFDHISFDAIYQSPVILVTQPEEPIGYTSLASAYFGTPALNTALATVVTNFQTTPAAQGSYPGGFPAINNITPTYANVVLADFATTMNKRSYYLGTSMNSSDATDTITIYGRRTVAQGDQVAPNIGQQLGLPNQQPGLLPENVLVTSVTAASNITIGGSAYPSWSVKVTRNLTTSGIFTSQNAYVGSTATLTGTAIMYDQMWVGPDYIHPGDVGASLIASQVLQAYLSAPGTSSNTYDNIAAQSTRLLQGRTSPYPRPLNNGYWYPRGTSGSFAMAANTVYAEHFYTPEEITVDELLIRVTTGTASSTVYFAILQDVSYGTYPGDVLWDFGLVPITVGTGTGNFGTPAIGASGAAPYNLAPGHYWLATCANVDGIAAVRGINQRFDEPALWTPNAVGPPADTGSATTGVMGYSWTPAGISGATITNMAISGTPSPIQFPNNTTPLMPRIVLHAFSQAYSAGG